MTTARTAQSPRLLITAGPTHEPIDAVRYIGNRSSARMGIALAAAALGESLPTTLLLGPSTRPAPAPPEDGTPFTVERFRTTDDLAAALDRHWPEHDVLIMAAAVADYRPAPASGAGPDIKLRRTEAPVTIQLVPTPDLVARLAASSRPDQVRIGFALEPEACLEDSALAKLERKGLHAIVANALETMDSEHITARLYLATGGTLAPPPGLTKTAFATWLIGQIPLIRGDAR